MMQILQRKTALKLGWKLFWMATGTRRVGLIFGEGNEIELLGENLIEERKKDYLWINNSGTAQ